MRSDASLVSRNRRWSSRRLLARLIVWAALGVLFGVASASASAATYEVTRADDAGTNTLRWAINSANANLSENDLITFDIAGANPQTIALRSDLPTVTDPVTIDGYTQTGATPAVDAATPAEPQIVVNATQATRGLRLETDGSTVRGLVVQAADGGQGIFFLADGIQVDGDANHIVGDFIGTDATGTAAVRNIGDGIQVEGDGNVIGGTAAADRNVIASNPDNVHIYSGTGNSVLGNLIGTDAFGATALGGGGGVVVDANDNTIGGSSPGAGNVISGNLYGVELTGAQNAVAGNLIGTTPDGTDRLGNAYDGIH